jgi:hypothetical protein
VVPIPAETGDNNVVKRLLVAEDGYDIAGLIRHALRSDGAKTIEVVGPGQSNHLEASLVAGRESLRYPLRAQ